MAVSVDAGRLSAPGTSEGDWRPWLTEQLANWPILNLHEICAPVVVAPHPDDEVLAAGGLLALADGAVVVGVSDGEASHPHSPTVTPAELAKRRQNERREALRRLRRSAGGGPIQLVECHLPDGALAEHESRIADVLRAFLGPDRWCVAPWQRDGHPDHEAVGRAAEIACRQTGARLLSYPVWAWHWARPVDPEVPWQSATVLPLPLHVQSRKATAIAAFPSQIQPLSDAAQDAEILPQAVLDRFRRPYEVYFR
jgi:LmbE family N-acetylglucosaminyl deacetylase